ncbi:hypothetical protein [Lactococcus formosensis]|uniref:hypothetical protein n=1 Tax=Lactococcus formosensis TaxID=1281486 RepID=UPI0013FE0A2D|nr:hypothetical protein [Lactococcus formosensis]NHI66301.1 hypothetical protein [Lactococcus petauri]NHI66727.1 hypothetical protein [Lactococcus garvieae]
MKSSWKKQRLATKKRSIKLMKWKNNFIRKYGYKRIAAFGVRASEAARKMADAFYPVLKYIRDLRKANEVVE